jgi:hypothetical protein
MSAAIAVLAVIAIAAANNTFFIITPSTRTKTLRYVMRIRRKPLADCAFDREDLSGLLR